VNQSQNALLDTIRQIVRDELQRQQGATLALVQEQHVDDGAYACTVQTRDAGIVLKQVPVATARLGLASIPAVNDLVLLQFIGGDINQPVIIGSLYNDEDAPPVNSDGQWVCELPPGDGGGLHFIANSQGTPSLELNIGSSLKLTLQDDDPVLVIDVGSGATALSIDSDGALAINGGRGLIIEAGGELVLKGSSVSIEGAGEVAVKGAVINLN
jgi:hypothetical protein